MSEILLYSSVIFLFYTTILYIVCDYKHIFKCLKLFLTRQYWEPLYNKVECASWFAKAIIILPGLLFGLQIWWFYLISLITSSLLIWASMRKSLPTLVSFNTLWIFISITAITKHFLS